MSVTGDERWFTSKLLLRNRPEISETKGGKRDEANERERESRITFLAKYRNLSCFIPPVGLAD